jgi:RNA recognition motif-containing protein
MNILIRNLPRDMNEAELKELFMPFGKLAALNIVIDSKTALSKGFGFVDMPNKEEAVRAIKELNNMVIKEQKIRVKITKKKNTATKEKRAKKLNNYKKVKGQRKRAR